MNKALTFGLIIIMISGCANMQKNGLFHAATGCLGMAAIGAGIGILAAKEEGAIAGALSGLTWSNGLVHPS